MAFSRDVGRLVLSFFRDYTTEYNMVINHHLRLSTLDEAKEMEEVFDSTWTTLALIHAASTNDVALVRYLMEKGLSPVDEENLVLFSAIEAGATDVVRELLRIGVDPSIPYNEPLIEAVSDNHLEIVILLLADGRVIPEDCENMAIVNAAEAGHVEMVRLLLADERVDPTDQECAALILAAENDHLEVVRLLIESGLFDEDIIAACREQTRELNRTRIVQYLDSILQR